jgi:predicted nucleotidyltransferase
MVSKREDILMTLREHKDRLCQKYPISRLALFGSWARGDQKADSDVDILIDVAPSIGIRFVSLADELENLLGRNVDLVSSRAVRPALWAEIQTELIDA